MDRNRFPRRPMYNPSVAGRGNRPSVLSEVRQYLSTIVVEGMRKHLCFGCSVSKLYDKNNKEYIINNRTATLEQVKKIVEEIKTVNQ